MSEMWSDINKPRGHWLSDEPRKDTTLELHKRIAELEQERDEFSVVIASMARQAVKDGSNQPLVDFCGTAANALEKLKLEQQAKGVEAVIGRMKKARSKGSLGSFAAAIAIINLEVKKLRKQAEEL